MHLEYTVKKREDARNVFVTKGMEREQVFQAKNNYVQKSDGTYTTRSCWVYVRSLHVRRRHTKDNAVLGKNTKEQYQILHGSVPNGTPPNAESTRMPSRSQQTRSQCRPTPWARPSPNSFRIVMGTGRCRECAVEATPMFRPRNDRS